MDLNRIESLLAESGLRSTPNRMLVLRELTEARNPLSLIDLETRLATVEKSSVHRVLASLAEHGLIHSMEDGRGITHYELCHGAGHHHSPSDMHAHFYCERCRRTFCLDEIRAPQIELPEGFAARSLNFMFKGLCPECSARYAG